MHLADAFIQSDSGYIFFVSMCSLGIEPTTSRLLTQCSTTEPQEDLLLQSNDVLILLFNNNLCN